MRNHHRSTQEHQKNGSAYHGELRDQWNRVAQAGKCEAVVGRNLRQMKFWYMVSHNDYKPVVKNLMTSFWAAV